MGKKITNQDYERLALKYGYPLKRIRAVDIIESNGNGFSEKTGRLIIQFEPSWFKRNKIDWQKDTKNTFWQANKVSNQTEEWKAFNSAFASDQNAAMKSTSIGRMQVMGFHYKLLGFSTVGAMWDFAKEGESNQLELGLIFIKKNPKLHNAMLTGNAAKFAYSYNGELYKKYDYDNKLIKAGF